MHAYRASHRLALSNRILRAAIIALCIAASFAGGVALAVIR